MFDSCIWTLLRPYGHLLIEEDKYYSFFSMEQFHQLKKAIYVPLHLPEAEHRQAGGEVR